jgi:WD40 repeat protein
MKYGRFLFPLISFFLVTACMGFVPIANLNETGVDKTNQNTPPSEIVQKGDVLIFKNPIMLSDIQKNGDKNIRGGGEPEFIIPGKGYPTLVKFSPGGGYLLSIDNIMSLENGYILRSFDKANYSIFTNIYNSAFTSDGKYVYVNGGDGIYRVDVAKGSTEKKLSIPLKMNNDMPLVTFYLSSDNRYLVYNSSDPYGIYVWDLDTSRIIYSKEETQSLPGAGSLLAVVPGSTVYVSKNIYKSRLEGWDFISGEMVWKEDLSKLGVTSKELIKTGPMANDVYVLIHEIKMDGSSILYGENAKLFVINSSTGKKRRILDREQGLISFVLHPDGRHILAADRDYNIRIYDGMTGKEKGRFNVWDTMEEGSQKEMAQGMALTYAASSFLEMSPNGQYLSFFLGTAGIYDLWEGKLSDIFKINYDESALMAPYPFLDADGKTLAIETENGSCLWNLESGEAKRIDTAASGVTYRLSLEDMETQDSNYISQVIQSSQAESFISPDRLYTVVTDYIDLPLKLMNKRNNTVAAQLIGHGKPGLISADFSTNGKILATAGMDNSIILWEIPSGRLLRNIKIQGDYIGYLEFSENDNILIARQGNGYWIINVLSGSVKGFAGITSNGEWITVLPSCEYVSEGEVGEGYYIRQGNNLSPLQDYNSDLLNPLAVMNSFMN